jgi:hypothetical protein
MIKSISFIGALAVGLSLSSSADAITRWHAVGADRGHDATTAMLCQFRSINQTPAVGCFSGSSPGLYSYQIPLETIWEGATFSVTLNASGNAWVPNITPVPANHTIQGRLITWNGALGLSCSTPFVTWTPAASPSTKSFGSCAGFQAWAQFAEAEFFVGNGAATTSSRARVNNAFFTYDF